MKKIINTSILNILNIFLIFLTIYSIQNKSNTHAGLKQSKPIHNTPTPTLTATVTPTPNIFNFENTETQPKTDKSNQEITTPTILDNIKITNIPITPDNKGYVYYPQCNGPYDKHPLPQGGNICKAGCGPTTVAMIVASFVDRNIDPIKMVDYYQKNGYYIGSKGSYYSDAIKVLKRYNLKVEEIFLTNKNPKPVNQLMDEMGEIIKNLQSHGWTFFVLANFCKGGCGHFFWLIQLDNDSNIWAYDPAYYVSKFPKPVNLKEKNPEFRAIVAVKK
jgi:hypothetical protein